MEFETYCFAVLLLLFTCVSNVSGHRNGDCPKDDEHGWWESNYKDGWRCILRCDKGFEPDNCHIIRQNKGGNFDNPVTKCVEESMISVKTVLAVGTGAAAVVAAPIALSAAGFGAAGVVAGSVAAAVQGPAVAAGSWFALGQSAGVLGLAATTKAALFGVVSSVTGAVSSLVTSCETE